MRLSQPHRSADSGRTTAAPAKWTRLCVAAVMGLSLPLAAAALTTPVAVAQSAREKCQDDTDQYNAAMEAAWQAANPGQQTPEPYPWPPYHCGGGIGIDIGGPGGGGGGGANPPAAGAQPRPDRWAGDSITSGGSGISQNGQDVGAPRTNVAPPPVSNGPSALESARSNVQVPVQPVQVIGADGAQQEVIAAGAEDQQWVVDERGLTTGQRVITDDEGVSRVVEDDVVAAGLPADEALEQATGQAEQDSTVDEDDDAVGSGGTQTPVGAEVVDAAADEAAAVIDDGVVAAAGAAAAFAGVIAGLRWPATGGGSGSGGSGSRGSAGRGGAVPPRPSVGSIGGEPPWRGQSAQFGWVQPDGDQQRFVLLADESSDRTHRFDMDVPDGGQMVVNPDGSVDVLDEHGAVVDHVRQPWAYDITGQPVDTWYEVDNDTDELVQVIDPDRTTRYPILADPEQDGAAAAKRNGSGSSDGRDYSQDQMVRNGSIDAEQARLDAQMPQRDPDFIGPVVAEDQAGQDRNRERAANNQQANIARGGSAEPSPAAQPAPSQPPVTASQSAPTAATPTPPPSPSAPADPEPDLEDLPVEGDINPQRSILRDNGDVVNAGTDGTFEVLPGPGRELVELEDGSVATVNSDGTEGARYPSGIDSVPPVMNAVPNSQILPTEPTLIDHPESGTVDVIQPNGSATTVDRDTGELIHLGRTDQPEQGPVQRSYYNPETEEFHSGPQSEWVEMIESSQVEQSSTESVGVAAAGAIGGQMIDSTAEGIQTGEVSGGRSMPSAASVGRAAGGAAFGGVLGTAADINSGMDPADAARTNAAGAAAGVVGAVVGTAILGPAGGFVIGAAASYAMTEYLQRNIDD